MGIECCYRCPTSIILLLSLLFFPLFSYAFPGRSTRQYLPPIPGYVPVYIQDGETPPDVESIVYEHNPGAEGAQEVFDNKVGNVSPKGVEARNIDDALKKSEEDIVRQLTAQQARLFSLSRKKRMQHKSNSYPNSQQYSLKES